MSEKVTIEADLVGVEKVNAGFRSMANESQQTGKSMRQLSTDITLFGTAASSIATTANMFGALNEEQTKLVRGMGALLTMGGYLVRVTDTLTASNMAAASSFATKTAATIADTAATWAHTIAEKARAVATAVANAVTSPLLLPIMLAAGAAASAAVATMIPTAHTGMKQATQGGLVNVAPQEILVHPAQLQTLVERNISTENKPTYNTIINVYEGSTAKVMDALRRAGIK